MPTLTWIGKDAVVNHDQDVTYLHLRDGTDTAAVLTVIKRISP